MTEPAGWVVHRRSGSAQELHEPVPPERAEPAVVVNDVTGAALVLGSSQADDVVDRDRAAAAGVAIARRRSGGGAVLLVPGDHVWIDVWLPRADPRWVDDVVRAADWLADRWVVAADALGSEALTVHRGNASVDPWSRLVCFAGRGPGEVFAGGRKLVGLSQRRTRAWTRFQCVVHRRWDAATTVALVPGPDDPEPWLDGVAVVGDADVEGAFLDALSGR